MDQIFQPKNVIIFEFSQIVKFKEDWTIMPEEMLFRKKKPPRVRASQWFKNGDHLLGRPDEKPIRCFTRQDSKFRGDVVHEYNDGCGRAYRDHGWIEANPEDTIQGGYMVCPGDWVVAEYNNGVICLIPYHPAVFEATYEKASD